MLIRPARGRLLIATALIVLLNFMFLVNGALARPAVPAAQSPASTQIVPDWISQATVDQLAVGIDVLVPASIPAPFGGEPSVAASSGYYSLYWVAGGGSPTFLQVIGTAGGEIPAYSKYDRNVELTPNATVNGNTAYHDLTPIYDLVYWQVGNVVYSVESQNSSVDSLTLANSLSLLAVPEVEIPSLSGSVVSPDQVTAGDLATVTVSVSGDATLTTDVGYFTASGTDSIGVSGETAVEWQSPDLTDPVTATFYVLNPADGSVVASTPTQILLADESEPDQIDTPWTLTCPEIGSAGQTLTVTIEGSGDATISANAGTFAGGSPATVIEVDGSLDIDYSLPFSGWFSTRLTLSDGEAAVATCEIAVSDEELPTDTPTSEPTELPDGVFPGDGTDMRIPGGDVPGIPDGFGTATPTQTVVPGEVAGDGTGMIEAKDVVPPTIAPTPSPTRTPKPGEPTSTPIPTETPVPTETATPENPIPTMVPQVGNDGSLVALEIGTDGGTLSSKFGVEVTVPKDTFTDMTSVTLQPVPDNQLVLQTGVSLVPESAFDISFAQLNGRGIDLGDKTATVKIDLAERWKDGATLYQMVNGQATALDNVSREGTVLQTEVSGPVRLVAGVPIAQSAAQGRSLVPFVIIALVAVILAIVAISILTSLRGRRKSVTIKRSAGSRRY